MAEEEQSQEKTEQPSAKRLKESREKGQVARSRDFNATVILLGTGSVLFIFGKPCVMHAFALMHQAFVFDSEIILTPTLALERMLPLAATGLRALAPLLLFIVLISIVAPLLIGGWIFSAQSMQPKFSRLNPLKGLMRMVSAKSLMETVKAILKCFLVGGVSLVVLKTQLPLLFALSNAPLETAISNGVYILVESFVWISASLLVIAGIDVPFQRYEHNKAIKMTKQELRDEYKETEGKPEVKGAIRRAQQDIARRRMMSEVPRADVILTNPTHYAVAIRYQKKGNKAPQVVAKGKDLMAFQIINVAKGSKVPIICVPPLARAIYFSTKLNAEVPRGLYVAVAQVLAYVFQLNNRQYYDYKPAILQNVPIPPDLAREAEEV